MFESNSEEVSFLENTPWYLDGFLQNSKNLYKEIEKAHYFYSQPNCHKLKFSFITPLWNTPKQFLNDLILSLRLQSYTNWEVIFVDDASTNKSHFSIIEKWQKIDSRIVFIQEEKNGGISSARNRAIQASTGDFVLILDHDDLIHPQTLEIFYEKILKNDKLNFLYSNEAKIDSSGKIVDQFFSKSHFSTFNLLRVNYICHLSTIKKSFLIEYGMTSEGIFRSKYDGAEDHDLFVRLSITNMIHSEHIPLFLYYWRLAETSTALSIDKKPKAYIHGAKMLHSILCSYYDITTEQCRVITPNTYKNDFYQFQINATESENILICIETNENDNLHKTISSIIKQQGSHKFTLAIYPMNKIDNTKHFLKYRNDLNIQFYENCCHEHFLYQAKNTFQNYSYFLLISSGVTFSEPSLIIRLALELKINSTEALFAAPRNKKHTENISFLKIKTGFEGSGYSSITNADKNEDHIFDDMLVLGVPLHCILIHKNFFNLIKLQEKTEPISDIEWTLNLNKLSFKAIYLGSLTCEVPKNFANQRYSPSHLNLINLNNKYSSVFFKERLNIININLQLKWNEFSKVLNFTNSNKKRYQFLEKYIFPKLYKLSDYTTLLLKKFFKPVYKLLRDKI